MAHRSEEERLISLSEKIKQLEAQKKQLQYRTKEKERKKRTHRLIQIGAVIDSMGINTLELAEKFKANYDKNPKSNEWLKKFIDQYELENLKWEKSDENK